MEIIKALELDDGTVLTSEDDIDNHFIKLSDTYKERVAGTFAYEDEEVILNMLNGEQYTLIKDLVDVTCQHKQAMDLWNSDKFSYE